MFSIGFPEFVLVALVMLIVVGPERLPQVARWCGRMIARGRGMLHDIQRELERNAELQELKKTGLDIREDITGVVQEFGKISDEVSEDVKRLGESFSLDSVEREKSDSSTSIGMDPDSEDHFQEEVEILRRARKSPGGQKPDIGGASSETFVGPKVKPESDHG